MYLQYIFVIDTFAYMDNYHFFPAQTPVTQLSRIYNILQFTYRAGLIIHCFFMVITQMTRQMTMPIIKCLKHIS